SGTRVKLFRLLWNIINELRKIQKRWCSEFPTGQQVEVLIKRSSIAAILQLRPCLNESGSTTFAALWRPVESGHGRVLMRLNVAWSRLEPLGGARRRSESLCTTNFQRSVLITRANGGLPPVVNRS
ncbi:hypothetical protein PM082_022965, partial [Marasmius tenuissimus]